MKFKARLDLIFFLIASLFFFDGFSQKADTLKWWDPSKNSFPVIEGQGWLTGLARPYDRLPARAEKLVRQPVWNLSRNEAGLQVNFKTDAKQIVVRYVVEGSLQMQHFPATGVSGVDLYSMNNDGGWNWSGGRYNFGDTIVYRFDNLELNNARYAKGREFRLYLPLYNKLQWLEIGVPTNTLFTPLPKRTEKPIVIYGTSITQGGCASRPGMAWTSILSRNIDREIINLGFSGNGRLEKEVMDFVVEVDAKAYVLDCLANLSNSTEFPPDEVKKRLVDAVKLIRSKHPEAPVILTAHATITDQLNAARNKSITDINLVLQHAAEALTSAGFKDIHMLEIKLGMDDTVDGSHPTDLGMLHYAEAYGKKLREVFQEPAGNNTTSIPLSQYRDAAIYDWKTRHNELIELNAAIPPKIVFFGNSITHYWGGEPKAPMARGTDSWDKTLAPLGTRNFGYGWDRIENVLWRVYHGELDGYKASQVVLMIGTNNFQYNTNEEILSGLDFLIKAIKVRQPQADILLLGIIPRRNMEPRVKELNKEIIKLAQQLKIKGAETGKLFLNKDGKVNEAFFTDGLHPNAEGYRLLANFLKPKLKG